MSNSFVACRLLKKPETGEEVGMREFLFTAVTGAIAEEDRLNTIANNLANVNTPGFKRSGIAFKAYFKEYLKKLEEEGTTPEKIPTSPDFWTLLKSTEYVVTDETYVDFSPGPVKVTGNPLDVAIDGQGFFKVKTPTGIMYTRNGNFTMNGKGELVTQDGYQVLDVKGKPIVIRGRNIAIGEDGTVWVDGNIVSRIAVVDIPNKKLLIKRAGQLFENVDPVKNKEKLLKNYRVESGAIEMSNVNVVKEMVGMIEAMRKFEAHQKVVTTFSDTTGRLINQLTA